MVVGGDAWIEAGARVEGDAYVLGGRLHIEPGGRVGGRVVSHPGTSSAWLFLLEGPALGLSSFSPVVLGAKAALLAAWILAGLILLATTPLGLESSRREIAQRPVRCFYVGLVAVASMVLTTLFLTSFAGAVVGVPFLALLLIVALVLKVWGTVTAFLLVGVGLLEHRMARPIDPLVALLVGIACLGALKLVPYVGIGVWSAITLVGVGAALLTKFGQRQPWVATDGLGPRARFQ